jgi:NAD(P)-dependent dehydrogenase (short-subunit alcohol dehydrogenase family)
MRRGAWVPGTSLPSGLYRVFPSSITQRAETPRELVERALAELGGIDVLVNNVGIGDTDDINKGCFTTCSTYRTVPGSTRSTCTSTVHCASAAPRCRA